MALESAVEVFDDIGAFEGGQLQASDAVFVQICNNVFGGDVAFVFSVDSGEAGEKRLGWLEGLLLC